MVVGVLMAWEYGAAAIWTLVDALKSQLTFGKVIGGIEVPGPLWKAMTKVRIRTGSSVLGGNNLHIVRHFGIGPELRN